MPKCQWCQAIREIVLDTLFIFGHYKKETKNGGIGWKVLCLGTKIGACRQSIHLSAGRMRCFRLGVTFSGNLQTLVIISLRSKSAVLYRKRLTFKFILWISDGMDAIPTWNVYIYRCFRRVEIYLNRGFWKQNLISTNLDTLTSNRLHKIRQLCYSFWQMGNIALSVHHNFRGKPTAVVSIRDGITTVSPETSACTDDVCYCSS